MNESCCQENFPGFSAHVMALPLLSIFRGFWLRQSVWAHWNIKAFSSQLLNNPLVINPTMYLPLNFCGGLCLACGLNVTIYFPDCHFYDQNTVIFSKLHESLQRPLQGSFSLSLSAMLVVNILHFKTTGWNNSSLLPKLDFCKQQLNS